MMIELVIYKGPFVSCWIARHLEQKHTFAPSVEVNGRAMLNKFDLESFSSSETL